MPLQAQRIHDRPIISPETPGWDPELVGTNINGPSLIRVPDAFEAPLGRYYLYFAHHQGKRIRLAYADALDGPWTIHTPGTLAIDQTPFTAHIASPDVHAAGDGRLVMVYHGCGGVQNPPQVQQPAAVATSSDGLHWTHQQVLPAESYLRAFELEGQMLGVAKNGRLYEAEAGTFDFKHAAGCLDYSGRHWAVHVDGPRAEFFYSRFGDTPEHILHFEVTGRAGLERWHEAKRRSLLTPQHDWEGAGEPITPSRIGASHQPVHQLRDPAVFTDHDGGRYLLYTGAGEMNIALAALTP